MCACNCGKPLPASARANRAYLEGHRERAYRKRLRKRLQDAGLPTSLSMKAADTATTTRNRHADAPSTQRVRQPRRPTPGSVRISYLRTLDAVTAELRHLNTTDPAARAGAVLDPLLTDRQRQALHG